MKSEYFAKAVDHALKELDSIEEAHRRIRTLAEEHSDRPTAEEKTPMAKGQRHAVEKVVNVTQASFC